MLKLPLVFVFSVIVFCMSCPSVAIDNESRAWVVGSGNVTCSEYIKAEETKKVMYHTWMMGYISGVNRYKGVSVNYAKRLKPSSLFLWMENYCKENPSKNFFYAVDLLLEETRKQLPEPTP